jgi:hypothetical protein
MGNAPLCAYKDAGGVPGQGLHALRIPVVDLAAVDVVGTVVIALLVARRFHWRAWIVVCAAFVVGFVAHALFCVDTRGMRYLKQLLALHIYRS